MDVASGGMAWVRNADDPAATTVAAINANLYSAIPREVAEPRIVTAVAKTAESGATEGAWLFDSVTGRVLYLDELQTPAMLSIETVEERTR